MGGGRGAQKPSDKPPAASLLPGVGVTGASWSPRGRLLFSGGREVPQESEHGGDELSAHLTHDPRYAHADTRVHA